MEAADAGMKEPRFVRVPDSYAVAGTVWVDENGSRLDLVLAPAGREEPEVAGDRDFLWADPEAGTGPVPVCGDSCRRAEGYIGYTWIHLPVRDCSAPLPKNAEAIFAIFAARMAFSSF